MIKCPDEGGVVSGRYPGGLQLELLFLQELPGIIAGGQEQQFIGCALLYDPAFVEEEDAIRKIKCLLDVVGD
jgi:hypothetical protein